MGAKRKVTQQATLNVKYRPIVTSNDIKAASLPPTSDATGVSGTVPNPVEPNGLTTRPLGEWTATSTGIGRRRVTARTTRVG
ncbi:hypothetical protein BIW11_01178 [Tropilaelaps mercedesae]|uniref:Uncharacterized protein n=1 Tax=Tropilaelaps mercedesae TaxID=418985 RepID=A0A1V9XI48_9ACAR|nr:hypothetical protein BIW11_01178 [Tropilaelaps mercedesae]